MAFRVRHPNLQSLVLLSLLAIASAKVFFEERFDGIDRSYGFYYKFPRIFAFLLIFAF
ncbi:calreticulin-like isoform X2 [Senna tora]|uniref:Calreticulin-like isoform X2 n=1 Tax=Senna tora TaxID=362788 RepID=A0A834W445_9FABA|nr:calreticulin-like isoform X2 [Senna tora]